ncbi:MAG: hypothetical protein ABIV43_01815 [Candidatus Saccharimonadales bacterium]
MSNNIQHPALITDRSRDYDYSLGVIEVLTKQQEAVIAEFKVDPARSDLELSVLRYAASVAINPFDSDKISAWKSSRYALEAYKVAGTADR